ncbi:UNKNOWN [Stylonychia lemnae]|uniref:PDEase domain-containing protein n=1 Tax=Stylonychia lemnae TaxID=5949 RepID=A0A078B6G6_STYLE|nr:UNKNOWN [Stylonychia lemnae]|eukprot:CDW89816.1 UNKNOWN [Stylonychia lemnae]
MKEETQRPPESKKIKIEKSYNLLEPEELQKLGIRGTRLEIALMLRSKPFDVAMIILIIFYTLLIFIFFAFVDTFFNDEKSQNVFYIIELVILGIFCIEIVFHLIGYGMLYLKDSWNIFDIVIIILSIIFVFLDIFVDNPALQGFLKIRSVFRVLRIFLLVRKLSALKSKREQHKRTILKMGFDMRSPLEKVLEILNELRDQMDMNDTRIIQDLNYCIKIIASNKLYEVNIDYDQNLNNTQSSKEVQMLLNTYSRGATEEKKLVLPPLVRRQSLLQFDPMNVSDTKNEQKKFYVTVDKVENTLEFSDKTKKEFEKIATLDFNIFTVQNFTLQNELVTITTYLLAQENMFHSLKIDLETFINFIEHIQQGYKDITYHNKTHGADLCQSFYYFSVTCGLKEKCKIDNLDFMALLVAGSCHDHEHPGLNNIYLTETRDPIAIRYNDVSVLENHHVASSFATMLEPQSNFMENFSKEQYKRARAVMIGAILNTDMSQHFSELGKFKARIQSPEFEPAGSDKDFVMYETFHLADISNATKQWDVCLNWTELLFVEFFHQGDLERNAGSKISYLMDRSIVNIAKSQIGYYDFIIVPFIQAMNQVISIEQNIQNVEDNKTKWQERFDEYEDRMNKEKENLTSITKDLNAIKIRR